MDCDALAEKARRSFEQMFWLSEQGYYADVLVAAKGQPAAAAEADDALRSNCLFAVSLGVAKGERARRCITAASRISPASTAHSMPLE